MLISPKWHDLQPPQGGEFRLPEKKRIIPRTMTMTVTMPITITIKSCKFILSIKLSN